MSDTWTIQAALDWTQGYLERKGDETPRVSAQWLLSEATGLSRIELYAHFDRPLSMAERDTLRDFVTRRGAGEPLQYITGEVGFRHISVKVRPGVLIPRPETEVLVSEALSLLPPIKRYRISEACEEDEGSEEPNKAGLAEGVAVVEEQVASESDTAEERPAVLVADLCTGSGCIACSIAHEYPDAQVFATDIAVEAVELASLNAEYLGLSDRVKIFQSDLGSSIPSELMGRFALVVSNPPYIPRSVLKELPSEVADFEPHLALDGGEDGLDFFRNILPWALQALAPGGSAVFELHETCLSDAAVLAQSAGFASTKIVCDLAGRERVLVATLPTT